MISSHHHQVLPLLMEVGQLKASFKEKLIIPFLILIDFPHSKPAHFQSPSENGRGLVTRTTTICGAIYWIHNYIRMQSAPFKTLPTYTTAPWKEEGRFHTVQCNCEGTLWLDIACMDTQYTGCCMFPRPQQPATELADPVTQNPPLQQKFEYSSYALPDWILLKP